jgi:Fic family protein
MNSFSSDFLRVYSISPTTAWFLSQCTEARGMQELWHRVRPETIKKLTEFAVIQSTESSNRIEGVEVEKSRLIPLVRGTVRARDRSEEEIVGYRKALNWIHRNYRTIDVSPSTVQQVHRLAQGGLISDAGKWKAADSDIIEILPNGERRIRFRCVSARETPFAIEQLCLGYEQVTRNTTLPDLMAIAFFVFDYLCVHPFRDGNGRVSRLLTLLLLYKHRYEVGRFVSLERIIESTKDDYYDVLARSSEGWHEAKHDLAAWVNYFLGVIKAGYQELKEKVEVSSGETLSAGIREVILGFPGIFSVADICKLNPTCNRELVKKVIARLKEENRIAMLGKGRGAKWQVTSIPKK